MEIKIGRLKLGCREHSLWFLPYPARLTLKAEGDSTNLTELLPLVHGLQVRVDTNADVIFEGDVDRLLKLCVDLERRGMLHKQLGLNFYTLRDEVLELAAKRFAEEVKR